MLQADNGCDAVAGEGAGGGKDDEVDGGRRQVRDAFGDVGDHAQ